MVFYETETFSDALNGHRIIIYCIQGQANLNINETILHNTETALEMLGKKNDDLLLVKILQDSEHFKQFHILYKAEVEGILTLFVVNNEGLPIVSKHICNDIDIFNAIEQLATTCKLNMISTKDLGKCDNCTGFVHESNSFLTSETLEASEKVINTSLQSLILDKNIKLNSTRLQIRLPSGIREEETFVNSALLQEVGNVISENYQLNDFDLKTYNHPIFSEDDYKKTLQDLDLCPTGVIIVVGKQVTASNHSGRIYNFVQTGIRYTWISSMFAFQYLQGIFFSLRNYIFSSNNGPDVGKGRRIENRLSQSNSVSSNSRSHPTKYTQKNHGNNVHTLHRNEESDDENNSYNGNSTQQK